MYDLVRALRSPGKGEEVDRRGVGPLASSLQMRRSTAELPARLVFLTFIT